MSTYIIDIAYPNHRLLHKYIEPPEVPDKNTLYLLREYAPRGLENALESINHSIAEHIGRQLLIATISENKAWKYLDSGEKPNF